MPTPRVLVLRSPGTNCDEETAHAFALAGGAPDRVHVNQLLKQPKLLDEYQILCLPGGFSYGDDLAAGRVLGSQIRQHLTDALRSFRDADKLVLGICNGFQVLVQTGLLDLEDDTSSAPQATLTWNDHGRYEARWVDLSVGPGQTKGTPCVFLRDCDQLELPIAHAEGKIAVRDNAALKALQDSGRLAIRYTAPCNDAAEEEALLPFPQNPNGSAGNAAGLCDLSGRVFGLMPHPERFIDRLHHPQWTRRAADHHPDGLRLFVNGVSYFG